MSKILKIRRGTKAEVENFPIPLSELIHAYDSDEIYFGGNSGNKKLPSRSEFESIFVNVLYPPVGESSLKGNDVDDDGLLFNGLITSLGAGVYFFPEGVYRIETTLEIDVEATLLFHENAKFHLVGNVSAINVNADNCKIYGGEIYSNGLTVGNGFYGIRVRGNYCLIDGVNVHDITYSAVMNSGKYNSFYNIVAKNVGWDCGSNFESSYAKWFNCKAFKTRRHGFSTDANTNNIEFHDCYVENVGHPQMAEGQSCFHFEGSHYGKVVNCQAVWNGDSNYMGVAALTSNYMKSLLNDNSKGVIVNGLDVLIDSTFIPTTPQEIYCVYQNNPAGQYVTEVNNMQFRNESNLESTIYLGQGNLELINCTFTGRVKAIQPSLLGFITKMLNCEVVGVVSDKKTFFDAQYRLFNSVFENNLFENVDYAVKGGQLVDCKFLNNIFKNSNHSIRLGFDISNSGNKSKRCVIRGNTIDNVATCIDADWLQTEVSNIVEENTFRNISTTVFNVGTTPSTLLWKNNKIDSTFVTTNYVVGSGLTLDSELRSEYDVVPNTVKKGVAIPDTTGVTLANLELEVNKLKTALRNAGVIIT